MIVLLFLMGLIILAVLCLIGIIHAVGLFFIETIRYDRKHGMKYTLTDSSFTAEWDFNSPLTMLKLTKLFIQCENNQEQRRKYIRQYNRLKESLKDKYDVLDFPDYKE